MLLLDVTIVNVALPTSSARSARRSRISSGSIDAYALTLAAFLLTAGSLADLSAGGCVFAVGIVVFTAGSLLCGLATGPAVPDARARRARASAARSCSRRRWR